MADKDIQILINSLYLFIFYILIINYLSIYLYTHKATGQWHLENKRADIGLIDISVVGQMPFMSTVRQI